MPRPLAIVSVLLLAGSAWAQSPADRSLGILKQGLGDAKEERRERAALALGLLVEDQRARELAEAALSDASPAVRAAAASTLGQIGLPASIPGLIEALKDKETEVVFSAAGALHVLGDPMASNVYYAVLTGQRKTGEPLLESQLKMLKDPQALAKIGFEAGMGFIPFGGVGTKVFKTVTQDKVSPVRAAAAQRLANDPDPRSAGLSPTPFPTRNGLCGRPRSAPSRSGETRSSSPPSFRSWMTRRIRFGSTRPRRW